MPLNSKGRRIMASMLKQYGSEEEAKKVFYASVNAGKITGVEGKDSFEAIADAEGHLWSRGVPLADMAIFDGVEETTDGYLKGWARVARVGTQKYKGYEVGLPDKDSVVLFRPSEEVFSRDAMHSIANKPITLTHPKRMVDAKNWAKVAKGFSGNEVMRDGDVIRIPLMLTDADTIDAYKGGQAREMSVGYTTDISWGAGTTADGEAYDGIQRDIRCNHIALVPVARGGRGLRFGDAWSDEPEDATGKQCWNCGASLTGSPISCPNCGFDLRPVQGAHDATTELPEGFTSTEDADVIGNRGERSIMPIMKSYDGVPVQFVDEASAAYIDKLLRTTNLKLRDAEEKAEKGDKDKADEEQEREKKERGWKDSIAARDGEIAALKKQLTDATVTDAQVDAMIAQRQALIDQATPFLPTGFKVAGVSTSAIRKAVVGHALGDSVVKDWADPQVEGAFQAIARGAKPTASGATSMARGMTDAIAATGGWINNGGPTKVDDADKAHAEYVERISNAYKQPISYKAN